MNPVLTNLLSIGAFIISLLALFLTYRKDAHRIHLQLTQRARGVMELGVNNDSSFNVLIASVGYFDHNGKVTWIPMVGESQANKFVDYPIKVETRSQYRISLVYARDIPAQDKAFGCCIRLATGRIYVVRGSAPYGITYKMYFAAILSQWSAGRFVLSNFN